ncbi:Protein CBG10053 [Caenorhabditis briggsae]|uniref:Protein NATD1 n=2 Tax=Caenorhabditis briggsae TaxID=6238 RepID=A0AAE9IQR2_CAEBR|nr:Protein CBG10053 [Caenorhabditis briggsae]ULU01956.1 hypothetical protein L3Y34_001916 [Caenorhabditis briggsae]UMM24585.1 hypothetical protein L5515_004752 [Caenorhabditis briggsae]CAP29565.1 Protein CBG10053 [Caenorhabditis briggsae]
MAFRVEHCRKATEFFIKFNTGSKAYLQYAELPNRVLDFQHTVTPEDQQGKGVARVLVKEGLKYAADNKYLVQPTCWYVAKYLDGESATKEEKELDIRHKL